MDNMRLPRPAAVRIERDHGNRSARIIVDGNDVSRHVTAVSWSMEAGRLPHATITFVNVEIAADAEDVESWSMASKPAEQAATDAHAVPELTVRLPDGRTLPYDECDFSAAQWEQLRAIAPNLVAAIESAKPVVARERVEPMGGPYVPVKLDPDAMAKLAANDGFHAPLG